MENRARSAYRRQRVAVGAAWTCAGALCVTFAIFDVVSLRVGYAGPYTDPFGDQAPVLVLAVAGVLTRCILVCVADRKFLSSPTFKGNATFAGALVLSICASASIGPALARVMVLFGSTLDPQLSGFLAACAVTLNAAILICLAATRLSRRLNAMVVIASMLVGAALALNILASVPIGVIAAALSAGALMYGHVQANLLLHVPDRYMIEWQRYMTQKWTVRGTIPIGSRPLRTRDVADDLMIVQTEYRMGVILSDVLVFGGFTVLALTTSSQPDPPAAIGLAAYAVATLLVLLLKPRTAGNPFDRMLMRGTSVAVIMVCLFAMQSHHQWNFLLPYVISTLLVIGIITASLMPALHSGLHSLMASRIADGLTMLGLALAAPSAFFASDCMRLIQGLMS